MINVSKYKIYLSEVLSLCTLSLNLLAVCLIFLFVCIIFYFVYLIFLSYFLNVKYNCSSALE